MEPADQLPPSPSPPSGVSQTPPEPTWEQIEAGWSRARPPIGPPDTPRNALGKPIWFRGRWRLMPSTAIGLNLYLGMIVVGSFAAGFIGLLYQFHIISDFWVPILASPLVLGMLAFWRFAHQHSPYARPPRRRR